MPVSLFFVELWTERHYTTEDSFGSFQGSIRVLQEQRVS
uniref:Uncharacterized protein n=1 Tax=Arundo donax TaxID=35708 RepID=A0A0A9FM70_ARUDO